jgi:hypothetical protein
MSLPDYAKIALGTPIVVANTDYSNNNGFGTRTHQINLVSKAAAGAQQSVKIDFGENLDLEYILGASLEFATAPDSGEVVNFYMGWSPSATTGVGNSGGLVGTDTAYTGTGGDSLADSLKQLHFLGSMVLTSDATGTVQIDTAIASFTPLMRYGQLVVENGCASAALHSDGVEIAFSMTPKRFLVQDLAS